MPLTGSIVVFVVIWWLVLYMVLPFGVRGQWEAGGAEAGTEPGAPVQHNLVRKLMITTGIAVVLWSIVWSVVEFEIITLRPETLSWDEQSNP